VLRPSERSHGRVWYLRKRLSRGVARGDGSERWTAGGVGDGRERELEGSFGVCGERREADWVVGDGEHINNWAATSQLGLHRSFGGESGHSLVHYI
jgi:hypothetical protein